MAGEGEKKPGFLKKPGFWPPVGSRPLVGVKGAGVLIGSWDGGDIQKCCRFPRLLGVPPAPILCQDLNVATLLS
ncbi:MAG: hypothetical protein MUC60_11890 [Oscillatoria sp. Prado101]|nr:hypothetical protein [Oscillatoria sp. Prado101]